MARLVKVATGTEAASDATNAIINKALAFPKVGIRASGGGHPNMPATWDGQGACPFGWTKQQQQVWVASASDAILPLPDALVPLLQAAPAQARLTGPEIAALATAIAGRSTVDLDAGAWVPKAEAVSQATLEA